MILHSDLIGVACDIVLGRESSLTEPSEDGFSIDQTLQDVRESAAAYLICAFLHATGPDSDIDDD